MYIVKLFSKFSFPPLSSKKLKTTLIKGVASLLIFSVLGMGAWPVGRVLYQEVAHSNAIEQFKTKGIAQTYRDTFRSVLNKMGDLDQAAQLNHELTLKVQNLEKELETDRLQNLERKNQTITQELAQRLRAEAGSELARVFGSIDYRAPSHLLPHQLYTLGLAYFRKEEYEKSAIIFSQLVELKEDKSYQRSEVQLLTGISWYYLEHYRLAQKYMDQAFDRAPKESSLQRKVMVWKSMVLKARHLEQESQAMLTQLIARSPHSEEAQWINLGSRKPAQAHSEDTQGLEAHGE